MLNWWIALDGILKFHSFVKGDYFPFPCFIFNNNVKLWIMSLPTVADVVDSAP